VNVLICAVIAALVAVAVIVELRKGSD